MSVVDSSQIADLTDREREVLSLVAVGMSNQEIADMFVISERTVRTHVSNILSKLNLTNRTQATLVAHQYDVVARGLLLPAAHTHRNGEAEPPTIPGFFWCRKDDAAEGEMLAIADSLWGEWRMRRGYGEWEEYKPHLLRHEGLHFYGPIRPPWFKIRP